MADATRHKPVEYYNPRPMILGLCFFWGIAMGFCLFYFAPPKQMTRNDSGPAPQPAVPQGMTDRERRHLDTPNIATVEPAPEQAQDQRPRLESLAFDLPPPLLTTEGGLTGRSAKPLTNTVADSGPVTPLQLDASPSSQPVQPQQQFPAPPPIPELLP